MLMLPCPLLSPRVCSVSYPLSQWCYLIISSSATPFPFSLQSCPTSGYFHVSSSHQVAKYWSFSFSSSSSSYIQGWFPLGFAGLISFLSKRLSRVFSRTIAQKHQSFSDQSSLWSNSHIHTCDVTFMWHVSARFDYRAGGNRTPTELGEIEAPGGHKQNFVCTRTQGNGAMAS